LEVRGLRITDNIWIKLTSTWRPARDEDSRLYLASPGPTLSDTSTERETYKYSFMVFNSGNLQINTIKDLHFDRVFV